jgi:ribosomal protein S18 acetylase RimI-like enzyme
LAPQPAYIRLRKTLAGPLDPPIWPAGIAPAAFDAVDAGQLHELLDHAFPGGLIPPFRVWLGNLVADTEYDPDLCVPAVGTDGRVAGFIQCWTSGFIKDLAVAPAFRERGLGAALMRHAFALFATRGMAHVDLKVQASAQTARRLYERLGMVEVPSTPAAPLA